MISIWNRYKCKPIKTLILSFFCAIALIYKPLLTDSTVMNAKTTGFVGFFAELESTINGWGMMPTVLWMGLFCLMVSLSSGMNGPKERQLAKEQKWERLVYGSCAIMLSLFSVLGKAMLYAGDIAAIYCSASRMLLSIVSLVGYAVLFFHIIVFVSRKIEIASHPSCKLQTTWGRFASFVFDSPPFLSSFILMALSEIPFWVFFFPGTAMADGLLQLTMYYGPNLLSNHHPALSTLFMGAVNDLGRMLGDNNFGLFFYLFLQSIAQFAVFSLAFVFAKRYKIKYGIRLAILIFLAWFPAFQVFAITLVKDTSFYIVFFAFILTMIGYWFDSGKKRVWWMLGFLVSGFGVWMFRNNGFYIVLIGIVALAFKDANKRRIVELMVLFAMVVIINSGYHNWFMPAYDIAEGSVREMLSIPTQQTARYALEHPNDITAEEREVLEKVFYCSIEELGQKYVPELSNNTKESFLFSPTTAELKQYFSVWFRQLIRHPGTYVNAAIAQNYGYWFPDRPVYDEISYYTIQSDALSEAENENLQFYQNERFSDQRETILSAHKLLAQLPGFSYLYSCGFYTWIVLFLCAVLVANRKIREAVFGLPIIASIAVNCVSPVNAYYRYQIPVIVVVPLFLMFVLISVRRQESNSEEKK